VTVTRRVVRCSSFTRRRVSSCCTIFVTVGFGICSESAARVKVPASTTRAKTRIAVIWSIAGLLAFRE
jgi:hypothetical protein